jgi:hypothetical protein
MPLTLGLTGMDPDTEAAIKAAFSEANERAGGAWQLVSEGEADNVIVDMDSMYGPMSWLKLHGAGKKVIGLTNAQRTQTDFHLPKPCSVVALANVLQAIAAQRADPLADDAATAAIEAPTPGQPAVEEAVVGDEPTPQLNEAVSLPVDGTTGMAEAPGSEVQRGTSRRRPLRSVPSGMTPAPAPQDLLPEEAPEAEAPGEPTPAPAPPAPARDPVFSDWLAPGKLSGRLRYQRDGGPALFIDADARQYHGPPRSSRWKDISKATSTPPTSPRSMKPPGPRKPGRAARPIPWSACPGTAAWWKARANSCPASPPTPSTT